MAHTVMARSFVKALGELFDFAGPVQPYQTATADEISRNAWSAVGRSMRVAMKQVDGELGYSSRQNANH